ncbi:protein of unknown function [Taphrina deformans PYCC 5710]|uniref:Uncharacterized protein n=1 Tax=Taphrina deformans (strain PYCC 5710 / ATCC 11124 / CBS 356.35 / IMI 108563 / JCM 9778 / NBRC 8474) TaxID=1097556 RepID=R4XDA2_TAPDE|nr:protein of unknown function [Taphrina deformans PYCC 5710]|eukprot:CCG83810.1 protein of unknown function [Taphrina deformans PYCC 5710]
MVSTKMMSTIALTNLFSILARGVAAQPENCCTLGAQFYNAQSVHPLEECAQITSVYGTKRWKCKKGEIVYNADDLVNGVGQDQIAMHIYPDPKSQNVHFTVIMECTGKSGSAQRALPMHCPTLSTQQMAGLGPVFKEPCASAIKVYSINPLPGFECSKLTLAQSL